MKTSHIPGQPALAVDHAGAGELLVLLHGIGGNRTNWTDQVRAFSPHFQTVAWDARGYKGSGLVSCLHDYSKMYARNKT